MENIKDLKVNFKSYDVKEWFNNNYFIGLYDRNDNIITIFDDIEEPTKFFNIPLFLFIRALKRGTIEYNRHKAKLYIFEKEKDDIKEMRLKK